MGTFTRFLTALSVALGTALGAHASALEDAESAYADFDYAACQTGVEEALDLAGSRDERVRSYRLLGLCHAALGETEEAREAFIVMLAIDPDAKLPSGLSPRFTSSYLEAKGHWLNKVPLELSIEDEREEGDLRVLTLRVIDNADLLRKVAWRASGGSLSPALRTAERMELRIPGDEEVEIVGLDESAGEVAVLEVQPRKPVVAPGEGEGEGEPAEGDPTGIIISLAVAGVVVIGTIVGVGAVILFSDADAVNLVGSVEFGE